MRSPPVTNFAGGSNTQGAAFMGAKRLAPKCHGLVMVVQGDCGVGDPPCHEYFTCELCGSTASVEWTPL